MTDSAWKARVQPHLGSDYELDRLWKEHEGLEGALADLDRVKWLTAEQEAERKRLQKEKLAGKDRMIAIVDGLGAKA